MVSPGFWADRNVLITGHTGFTGAWLSLILRRLGSNAYGLALPAETPSLFDLANVAEDIVHVEGDLRQDGIVEKAVARSECDIVFHFAAESLVRRSFASPALAFETNVMGSVRLFEALLRHSPRAILVTTTDKVYRNDNSKKRFTEAAPLGGFEPYSASKVGQEMVASAYGQSYFEARGSRVAVARAGNLIGGGDFGMDRLVPDLIRAALSGTPAAIRKPKAVRPFQHVFDCLWGYLGYVEMLVANRDTPRALNFGPEKAMTVTDLADAFGRELGIAELWRAGAANGPREADFLEIDATLARRLLGWREVYPGDDGVRAAARWYKSFLGGADMRQVSLRAVDDLLDRVS